MDGIWDSDEPLPDEDEFKRRYGPSILVNMLLDTTGSMSNVQDMAKDFWSNGAIPKLYMTPSETRSTFFEIWNEPRNLGDERRIARG
jgi:hypothetical protein